MSSSSAKSTTTAKKAGGGRGAGDEEDLAAASSTVPTKLNYELSSLLDDPRLQRGGGGVGEGAIDKRERKVLYCLLP